MDVGQVKSLVSRYTDIETLIDLYRGGSTTNNPPIWVGVGSSSEGWREILSDPTVLWSISQRYHLPLGSSFESLVKMYDMTYANPRSSKYIDEESILLGASRAGDTQLFMSCLDAIERDRQYRIVDVILDLCVRRSPEGGNILAPSIEIGNVDIPTRVLSFVSSLSPIMSKSTNAQLITQLKDTIFVLCCRYNRDMGIRPSSDLVWERGLVLLAKTGQTLDIPQTRLTRNVIFAIGEGGNDAMMVKYVGALDKEGVSVMCAGAAEGGHLGIVMSLADESYASYIMSHAGKNSLVVNYLHTKYGVAISNSFVSAAKHNNLHVLTSIYRTGNKPSSTELNEACVSAIYYNQYEALRHLLITYTSHHFTIPQEERRSLSLHLINKEYTQIITLILSQMGGAQMDGDLLDMAAERGKTHIYKDIIRLTKSIPTQHQAELAAARGYIDTLIYILQLMQVPDLYPSPVLVSYSQAGTFTKTGLDLNAILYASCKDRNNKELIRILIRLGAHITQYPRGDVGDSMRRRIRDATRK
jgi:hypothetical protein